MSRCANFYRDHYIIVCLTPVANRESPWSIIDLYCLYKRLQRLLRTPRRHFQILLSNILGAYSFNYLTSLYNEMHRVYCDTTNAPPHRISYISSFSFLHLKFNCSDGFLFNQIISELLSIPSQI